MPSICGRWKKDRQKGHHRKVWRVLEAGGRIPAPTPAARQAAPAPGAQQDLREQMRSSSSMTNLVASPGFSNSLTFIYYTVNRFIFLKALWMSTQCLFLFIFSGDQKVTEVIHTLHLANICSSRLNESIKFINHFLAATHFRQLRQSTHHCQHRRRTARKTAAKLHSSTAAPEPPLLAPASATGVSI